MISNFDFLKEGFPSIYYNVKVAESRVFTEPKNAAYLLRLVLEEAVHNLYQIEPLEIPFDVDGLASLLRADDFVNTIPSAFIDRLHIVRKIGNNGAHYGKKVSTKDALTSIRLLFEFLKWFANLYADKEPVLPGTFDKSLIPKVGSEKGRLRAIQEEARREQERLQAEMEALKEEVVRKEEVARQSEEALAAFIQEQEREKQILNQQKAEREKPIAWETTEAETRKALIDLALRDAGWDQLHPGREIEFYLQGMPITNDNPKGNGYADYVLWDDDGLPLAVIEAKRSSASPEQGRHQARLYADCLEKMFDQRPVIFYTNGFRTFIWDDTFYSAPRRIYGFYTKDELQWTIQRRNSRKDIRKATINQDITGRPYQIEGIKRMMESLVVEEPGSSKLRGAKRDALLVMATGSGKTRTSASIVDVLTKGNWVKRVLFLADRNALVTQAKNAFSEHLPNLSSIDLTQEKENNTTRLVFSTYQSIINKIDAERNEDGRFYGVGHFDLIIVDEAHRSVYNKFGIIFDYFDAMLLGLTATPKKDIDHNTYDLFGCGDGNPTFAYELEDAVDNGYLVPYQNISLTTTFLSQGLKYQDLSEEEKDRYEDQFRDDSTGLFPEHIRNSEFNKWLFNKDTVNKILDELMQNGLKIEGGDKIGRTIIFATNQDHADFIQKCFEERYPQYPDQFMAKIYNNISHVQSLILSFCDHHEEKLPQIAVSVDMMDTGVDAPRVLNLVFFKPVRSYAKFWQMIGRGTRLCPDVFGPGEDKKYFLIFDACGNFEFFNERLNQTEARIAVPISQQIFLTRLAVARLLFDLGDDEDHVLAREMVDKLHGSIGKLSEDRFDVQMQLEYVKPFKDRDRWNHLDDESVRIIEQHLAPLPIPEPVHERTRRFDLLILKMLQANLLTADSEVRYHENLISIADKLSKKYSVPQVARSKALIEAMRNPDFYDNLTRRKMEEIREEIRELVQYLEYSTRLPVYTDYEDSEVNSQEGVVPYSPMNNELYKKRVEQFIREHKHHITISKLNTNQQITEDEIQELQKILFDGGDRGSFEQYRKVYGDQPLGKFIRSIVGLDIQAANEAFSDFLQSGQLNANQIKFIDHLIQHLNRNGTIDKGLLFKPPFTDAHQDGPLGLFRDDQAMKIFNLLDRINENADVG